jgi:glycosyltransferase involved in cell wall biosynthesis
MQPNLSIVIICKNEAANIEGALQSALAVAGEIVVYDSGSTDDTVALARAMGIPVHRGPWLGFGPTRRAATMLAKNDWVFCLDADERIEADLASELTSLQLHAGSAWTVRLRNHLGDRHIRWGAWGNDFRLRLFNRYECNWNDDLIHERVVPLQPVKLRQLNGSITHLTAKSVEDYRQKMEHYAQLTAQMYRQKGKPSTWVKRSLSPLLTFVKSYFGKLGFLEGAAGWKLSKATAAYTRKKYGYLEQLSTDKGS